MSHYNVATTYQETHTGKRPSWLKNLGDTITRPLWGALKGVGNTARSGLVEGGKAIFNSKVIYPAALVAALATGPVGIGILAATGVAAKAAEQKMQGESTGKAMLAGVQEPFKFTRQALSDGKNYVTGIAKATTHTATIGGATIIDELSSNPQTQQAIQNAFGSQKTSIPNTNSDGNPQVPHQAPEIKENSGEQTQSTGPTPAQTTMPHQAPTPTQTQPSSKPTAKEKHIKTAEEKAEEAKAKEEAKKKKAAEKRKKREGKEIKNEFKEMKKDLLQDAKNEKEQEQNKITTETTSLKAKFTAGAAYATAGNLVDINAQIDAIKKVSDDHFKAIRTGSSGFLGSSKGSYIRNLNSLKGKLSRELKNTARLVDSSGMTAVLIIQAKKNIEDLVDTIGNGITQANDATKKALGLTEKKYKEEYREEEEDDDD